MLELLWATINGIVAAALIVAMAFHPIAPDIPVPYRLSLWVGAAGLLMQVPSLACDASTALPGGRLTTMLLLLDAGYWIIAVVLVYRNWHSHVRGVPKQFTWPEGL